MESLIMFLLWPILKDDLVSSCVVEFGQFETSLVNLRPVWSNLLYQNTSISEVAVPTTARKSFYGVLKQQVEEN